MVGAWSQVIIKQFFLCSPLLLIFIYLIQLRMIASTIFLEACVDSATEIRCPHNWGSLWYSISSALGFPDEKWAQADTVFSQFDFKIESMFLTYSQSYCPTHDNKVYQERLMKRDHIHSTNWLNVKNYFHLFVIPTHLVIMKKKYDYALIHITIASVVNAKLTIFIWSWNSVGWDNYALIVAFVFYASKGFTTLKREFRI